MNRRNFLKSIATACGAAVVCPGELLKKHRHPGIDKIPEQWKAYYSGGHFKSEAEYEKFVDKFRTALKNTKFKPPLKQITYRGMPIYYQENLLA